MTSSCAAAKQSGEPCRARPLRGGKLCFLHDPEHAEAAADARKLGGQRRRREGTVNAAFELSEIDSVEGEWRLLEVVITDALELDNGAPRLRILIAALGVAAKLRESTDVEIRLARLEAIEQGGHRPAESGESQVSLLDGSEL